MLLRRKNATSLDIDVRKQEDMMISMPYEEKLYGSNKLK